MEFKVANSAQPIALPNPFAAGCAWIDGKYVPIGEASIPILDTGFVRSDLTYDVASVWEGRFFRLDDHLERFFTGCERLRLIPPLTKAEIRSIMVETVRRSGLRDAYVEVIVTRGVPGPGQRDPRLYQPRLYVYAIPYVWIVKPELQARGTDVFVTQNTHRIPTSSVDPTVKNFHWGDFIRGMFEAYDRDAWVPILPDQNGMVTEGPGFNVFAMVDDVLYTPMRGVLEGITRRTAIEIAKDIGIEVIVGEVPVEDLYRSTEMFLTSTAGGVMPVATLDGKPVGTGQPGPVTTKIRDRYWELHTDPRFSHEVDY
jgi:branched-subunit amino acid aminotransferase/4-amino-4-deoxychorismate lyase